MAPSDDIAIYRLDFVSAQLKQQAQESLAKIVF